MQDFSPFFDEYVQLTASVERLCAQVAEQFSHAVRCREGCTDCCHALFDIPLIEAIYLQHHFSALDDGLKQRVWIDADKVDRHIEVLKKRLYKEHSRGGNTQVILQQVASERVRCPLLGEDDRCALYAYRPLTCRIYGLPLDIHGQGRSCGLSGFVPGEQYPAIKVAPLQDRLVDMSRRLLVSVGSPYLDFATMFVPVSRALLTTYDAAFFGLEQPDFEEKGE